MLFVTKPLSLNLFESDLKQLIEYQLASLICLKQVMQNDKNGRII